MQDIVGFARRQKILCQGRGSAANSAVCFALGITELDPERINLLFERFLSRERNEPPDIDVDFEHERREEVIQYVFNRYGRQRAALTAVVSTYHGPARCATWPRHWACHPTRSMPWPIAAGAGATGRPAPNA
ncbi:error-prone DNA polymerase [Pseudomonas aeruginosa]|nr:error-prone DNA polymerase [Pseudomonas aeruginosa]